MIIPLIIIQVLVFAALVIFLRKMIFSSSSAASRKIQQMTEETERKSTELSRRVAEVEEEIRQKMLEAEKAVKDKLDEAAEESAQIKSGIIHKAQEEASAIIAQRLIDNLDDRIKRLREQIDSPSIHDEDYELAYLRERRDLLYRDAEYRQLIRTWTDRVTGRVFGPI